MIDKLKRFNYISFLAMAALIALGTVTIWSAGAARSGLQFHDKWMDNLLTAVFGLGIYFVLAFTDYRRFLEMLAWPFYGGALVMLILVLLVGDTVLGGKRWLWFFQPSEIAKFCLISLGAGLLGSSRFRQSYFRKSFVGFLAIAGLMGVPCLLILAEPDLGTMLALVPALVVMMLVAGVWRKGLVLLMLVGAMISAAVVGAVYEAEKPGVSLERRERILAKTPLRPHQVKRVKTFLFPESDPSGAGYNLRESLIAIGSGGYSGKGLRRGETNRLKYLPPAVSMNDFIFCVYGEERGFLGAVGLLFLFGVLLLSGCWIAWRARDLRGRLIALGFTMLIFAHVYVNIGMSIGLVPITGLPLPFISAGRTFLVTLMAGLGLVQSVAVTDEREENN